ncbi:MAG: 50S ribosomal protein L27, partial [Bacteroidota bacterium]
GAGVGLGKDHTIFAMTDGVVKFTEKTVNTKRRKVVNVVEAE